MVQDISSYVIARTLGVVDSTKASTSDKATIHHEHVNKERLPVIQVDDMSTSSIQPSVQSQATAASLDVSEPPAYFTSEEHNLKLSGAGALAATFFKLKIERR